MKQKKTFKISQEKEPLSAELELRKIRKNIDAVDAEIIRLIHKRVEHVLRVGELKGNQGSAIYRPEREKFILDQILEQNKKN
ncbi:MAG: chorismate mutase, partial [Spirochaetia bacterium]|nr:chorismate mutase [Spirochaetia bacterium]